MSVNIEHSVTVRNFEEFRDDIRAFAEGRFNFLIVVGNNGLSKTETVRQLVSDPLIIEGKPTPLGSFTSFFTTIFIQLSSLMTLLIVSIEIASR